MPMLCRCSRIPPLTVRHLPIFVQSLSHPCSSGSLNVASSIVFALSSPLSLRSSRLASARSTQHTLTCTACSTSLPLHLKNTAINPLSSSTLRRRLIPPGTLAFSTSSQEPRSTSLGARGTGLRHCSVIVQFVLLTKGYRPTGIRSLLAYHKDQFLLLSFLFSSSMTSCLSVCSVRLLSTRMISLSGVPIAVNKVMSNSVAVYLTSFAGRASGSCTSTSRSPLRFA